MSQGAPLVGAERYQVDKLEALERGVEEQAKQNTYNLDANLALLRFYQFQPSKVKIHILARVLLKAMMQLPRSDYRACVHLIPEKLQSDETIYKVVQLANSLDTSRFQDFWTASVALKDVLSPVTGFYDAIRTFILHVVSLTFQRIPKKTLSEYLRLESGSLDAVVKEKCSNNGWTILSSSGGDIVVLPKTDSQRPVKHTQDVIKFDSVLPALKMMTVGF